MANNLDSATTARILYARELLAQLKKSLFLGQTVSRKYEQTAKPLNGIVRVPSLTVPAVQKRTKNAAALTAGDTTTGYVDITLTEHAVVPMTLDSLDAVISDIDFRVQMAQRAAYNIAAAVETDIASLYYKVGNVVGAVADDIFKSSTNYPQAAIKLLDDNLAPPGIPRFGALSAGGKQSALASSNFISYNNAGQVGANTLVSAQLGERFGINWGLCQSIPTHTGGGIATNWAGTVLTNNAGTTTYPVGTTTIDIDGFTAAAPAIKKGDAFKILGHYYTSSANYTGSGNAIAGVVLGQPQGLLEAVPNNTALTVGAGIETGVQQLIYLPDAFALATAPMDDERPGTMSNIVTDEQTGLSIRVTYSYQHLAFAHIFTTELLYGFQCIRPELAVRVASLS